MLYERATHPAFAVGDHVHLTSGSPLGVVTARDGGKVSVEWQTAPVQRSTLPDVCLRGAEEEGHD